MKRQIPLYFCDMSNFGDALNKYIISHYISTEVKFSKLKNAELIGIGSILDNCLLKRRHFLFHKIKAYFSPLKTISVFSSGFGFEESDLQHNKSKKRPYILKYKLNCYALRGKLSLNQLMRLQDVNKDVVLGDGGLLASELVDKSSIACKYDLGIVPHYADAKNEIFAEVQKKIPNSTILDARKDPILFLKDLCECEAIISTAMHPLIAADSLCIPNLWVRISEKTTSRYKFHDYYSVFDLKKEPTCLKEFKRNISADTVSEIISSYNVSPKKVEQIQNDLKTALKKFARDFGYLP